MSKLSDLIQELCPNGVETFPLDQVLKSLPKGTLKTNELVENGRYPVINGGRDFYGYYDKFNNSGEVITFSSRGFAGYVQYMNDDFWAGGLCYPYTSADESALLTKFAYYYLKNKESYIMQNIVEHGSIPALNKKDLHKVQIFVPPLPVQREIVRILDTFTELTKELTKELTLRKKQYEYYRDRLLTFEERRGEERRGEERRGEDWFDYGPVKRFLLEKIADIGTGSSNTNEGLEKGLYPFFVRSQTPLRKNEYEYDETAIITAGDGNVGKVFHYVEGKYALHQRAYRIHINHPEVLPKYFFYYMSAKFLPYIEKTMFQGSVSSIRRPMLDAFPVTAPPLPVQREIVRILDKFEALCHDLTAGLPAEIAARQKQYEYYRDKLLSFRPMEENA